MEFASHAAASAALTTLNQRLFLEKVSIITRYFHLAIFANSFVSSRFVDAFDLLIAVHF